MTCEICGVHPVGCGLHDEVTCTTFAACDGCAGERAKLVGFKIVPTPRRARAARARLPVETISVAGGVL